MGACGTGNSSQNIPIFINIEAIWRVYGISRDVFLLNNDRCSDTVGAMKTHHSLFISGIVGLLVSALLTGVSCAQSQTNNPPRLICEHPFCDFGEMDNRKTVEHTFTVRNCSTNPIEITKVFSGCKCASATNIDAIISPGKETGIQAKIALHGREGAQKKSFYIHYKTRDSSNVLTNDVLQLEMDGVAIPWIRVVPGRIDFGNLEKDAKIDREIGVSWKAGLKFALTNVQITSKCLAVSMNANQPGKIIVSTIPPLPPGIIRGDIIVLTDDPSCPSLEIPVIALALCDIVVVPAELSVGSGGWTSSKYIGLRSRTGKQFKIVSVEVPDPGIKYTIMPMGSQGYRLELPPVQLSSDIDGEEIKIRTDLPGSEELVVPFVSPAGAQKK